MSSVEQCAEEFELYLGRLASLIQQNSETLLTLPESLSNSICSTTSDR